MVIFEDKTSRVSKFWYFLKIRIVKCAKANFIVVLSINKGSLRQMRQRKMYQTKIRLSKVCCCALSCNLEVQGNGGLWSPIFPQSEWLAPREKADDNR